MSARLKALDQVLGSPDAAVAKVAGIAPISKPLPASGQCRRHLPAEPFIGEGGLLPGHQLAVEPGGALMADLLVKAGGRQDADPDVRPVPCEIVGLAALGKIGGDAPVVGVDPLDMAGPAQRLQPADVGTDVGLGIAADAVDGGARPLQMLGRTIDAFLAGNVQDVAVCGARTGRAGAGRHDHAPPDFLGAGGIHLDVMHAPVHAVDHQPNPFAHLVAAQALVEHPADDALGRLLPVQDVARERAVLGQALRAPAPGAWS